MQGQSLLAGLRALVEQIDQIERQNALQNAPVSYRQPAVSEFRAVTMHSPVQNMMSRRTTASRATGIVQRLGVSNNDLFRVANAVGRNGYATH